MSVIVYANVTSHWEKNDAANDGIQSPSSCIPDATSWIVK